VNSVAILPANGDGANTSTRSDVALSNPDQQGADTAVLRSADACSVGRRLRLPRHEVDGFVQRRRARRLQRRLLSFRRRRLRRLYLVRQPRRNSGISYSLRYRSLL